MMDLDQMLLKSIEYLFEEFSVSSSDYSALSAGDHLQGKCKLIQPYVISNILVLKPNRTTFESFVELMKRTPVEKWPWV